MSPTAGPRPAIFITGAASGMGRETAKLFASKGWLVGATDVNLDGLKTLEQELGSENVWISKLDVTSKGDFDAAIAAFGQKSGGRLDVMFNNAGIGESGWFEDVPYDAAMRVVQINLRRCAQRGLCVAAASEEDAELAFVHDIVFVGDLWHAAHRRLCGDQTCGEGFDGGALR
jgi:NAD(P)-dependent dehydrogenase (short-subunit alcohol dehydrogenase family)